MEATKSMMLHPKRIQIKANEYTRMYTKSLCSSVDEEGVDAPNQFDDGDKTTTTVCCSLERVM
jgi:hypothetical protein